MNRALLANQRALAKLLFKLMKSVLQWELSHRCRWQDTLQDWKLIQKNCVVHNFREFMAKEEIKNPPSGKTQLEEMIMGQIFLGYRRLELLQHLSGLLPPTHSQAELEEWYSSLVNLN
ncbi:CC180 protein, partial [Bucco capensis]|nr:CC180 protein [Bucco capensis]